MDITILDSVERIITHGNCPDGMASGLLLYDALEIEPEFHIHGMDAFQNLEVTPNTLFCDICPPDHLVDAFVEAGGIVLDHHKAVKEVLPKFGERGVFADETEEPGVSGAVLAFREVWEPKLASLVPSYGHVTNFARLAGVRDTWQLKDKDWELASHQAAALTFYPWEHWKDTLNRYDMFPEFEEEMKVGKMIFESRMFKAAKCAEEAYITTDSMGMRIAVFNDPDKLTSDVSEMLRKEGVNIIAGFFYSKANAQNPFPVLCFSLRSDGTFDVSKFAETLGGGGHSKAAGYVKKICMEDDPFSIFLNDLERYAG